jgi:hypothetical protein
MLPRPNVLSALGLLLLVGVCRATVVRGGETVQLEVRETAGLRRYAYPVTGEFRASWNAADSGKLELRDGQRSLPAQFTLLAPAQGEQLALWAADFSIDLAPFERRVLSVWRATSAAPQSTAGFTVEARDGDLHVRSKSLVYIVPGNLQGVLSAMRVSGDDWLAGPGEGLVVSTGKGTNVPLRPAAEGEPTQAWRIVKPGPLAVVLERRWTQSLDGPTDVDCRLWLEFPLGKSWVRIECTVEDPGDAVAQLRTEFRLRLEATAKHPILGDVGAGGWTYAALRPAELLRYRAGEAAGGVSRSGFPAWRVDRVRSGQAEPFAVSADTAQAAGAPGWAHLSDARRATAIALDQFGSQADAIELGADGRVALSRDYLSRDYAVGTDAARTTKRLTCWLHFVAAPAQFGAATSPQSMLTPPQVHGVEAAAR